MRLTLLKLMQRVLFRNLFLNRVHSERIEQIVISLLEGSWGQQVNLFYYFRQFYIPKRIEIVDKDLN